MFGIAIYVYQKTILNISKSIFILNTALSGVEIMAVINKKAFSFDENTSQVSLKTVDNTFIKESSDLTHITINGEVISATPEHPFYVPVKGWVNAADLRAGDILFTVNGEYVTVEAVSHEILENPVLVYNFEVAENHTYFVGESAVGVHNTCLTDEIIALLKKEQGWSDEILEAIGKNDRRASDIADVLKGNNLAELTVDGRKSLTLGDIDLYRVDNDGLTNLQRMQKGAPPLDANGSAIELHHLAQTMDSPYVELTWTEHRGKGRYAIMHNTKMASKIDRNVFNKQKEAYWKERAKLLYLM